MVYKIVEYPFSKIAGYVHILLQSNFKVNFKPTSLTTSKQLHENFREVHFDVFLEKSLCPTYMSLRLVSSGFGRPTSSFLMNIVMYIGR